MLTVNVLQLFEATLEQVTALALFIPPGRNGRQRGRPGDHGRRVRFAVGELRTSDLPKLIWRESRVGILLGAMLAIVGMVVGTIVGDGGSLVVGLSLIAICAWAASVGRRCRCSRRASTSTRGHLRPMVTTLVDATGLIIYFGVAKLVLGSDPGSGQPLISAIHRSMSSAVRGLVGEDSRLAVRDHDVVLDPDADAPQLLGSQKVG